MLYLSGLFFPLPKVLETWAVIWPTYHLNRIAAYTAGSGSDSNVGTSIILLLGTTVVCTVLAARRFSRFG